MKQLLQNVHDTLILYYVSIPEQCNLRDLCPQTRDSIHRFLFGISLGLDINASLIPEVNRLLWLMAINIWSNCRDRLFRPVQYSDLLDALLLLIKTLG